MPLEDTELELVRQAAAGDRAALSQLLLIHYDGLERHIRARISDDLKRLLLADDILQQVFVRAAQSIGSYQPRHAGAFRAWLKTIADNLIKNAEKHRHRERRASGRAVSSGPLDSSGSWAAIVDRVPGDATSPSVSGQRHENVRRIRAALAALPMEQRDVLERYYLREESLEQIAEALGATKDSIRGICYRGRKSLRALLGEPSLYFSG